MAGSGPTRAIGVQVFLCCRADSFFYGVAEGTSRGPRAMGAPSDTPQGRTPLRLQASHKDLYAFYFRKLGFGFGQAIEINTYTHGPSRLQVVGVKWLFGNVSGPTADGSPRTTKSPYSLNWKVMREEFYATKEAALGAIEGKRYLKGTKTLPIEPLTVMEVRNSVDGRRAQRRHEAKP